MDGIQHTEQNRLDEAFSSRGAKNITLQRTLISEALNEAGHKNYPVGTQHGYAASIGGNVGSFPRGWAYYYAEQDDPGTGFWGADDVGLCVAYPGPFERILTQNYNCANNEVVQGFKGVFIEPNTGSMTVNLNPPR